MKSNKKNEILERLHEMIPEEERIKIHQEYRCEDMKIAMMSDRFHRKLTGSAMDLVCRMIDRGAIEKEIKTAMVYLSICMDCVKHHLNWKRFAVENGIVELRNKYPVTKIE